MKGKGTPLKKFIFFLVAELFLLLFVVWFFDPFYQYHPPFFGEAVLNDRDNQMPGTIRNFAYDSVLMGSSVTENCDQTFLDRQYGISTLKIIRASGSASDLIYYLDMARENRDVKRVFWCLDLFALDMDLEPTLKKGNDTPWYLHTKTVTDDVTYLCNKEILLETIPKNLFSGIKGINTGGNAYNWAKDKKFGAEYMMRFYEKPAQTDEPVQEISKENKEIIEANIDMLVKKIKECQDEEFTIFFPPYSMAWWDCSYVNGLRDKNLYIFERVITQLLECPNVNLYSYMDLEEVTNLDNYMDMIHYRPEINQKILELLVAGEGEVTRENKAQIVDKMIEFTDRISREEIYRYYER